MRSEDDKILSIFSIVLNQNTHGNRDIVNLFSLLNDMDTFVSVLTLFSGRRVQFPTKDEIKESMLLTMIYYYRYYKKMEWKEVHEIIPYDFSTMEYAFKIKNLNKTIREQLESIIHG